MKKHALIIGAGPGLSLANARRFGAAGYAVHLVGRTADRLTSLVETLREEGIDVSGSVGDTADYAGLTALIQDIDARHPVDACIFQPGIPNTVLVDVLKAEPENIRPLFDAQVLGAVAVGHALAPEMTKRGTGAIVFVGGGSARMTLRMFGNLGPVSAALRSYALTLSGALAETGVYAGFFTISAMIATGEPGRGEIAPTTLADRMLRLVEERDVSELIMTADGEVVPKGAHR